MNRSTIVIALLATALAASATPAVATKLITGKDIRNGSVTEVDLDAKVRTKLANSGKPGPTGAQGERGATGATGIQGPQGRPGATGQAGDRGVDGRDGRDGINGSQGSVGPRGLKGDAGPRGPAGADGQDGVSGLSEGTSRTDSINVGNGIFAVTADCPNGKVAIAGEHRIDPGNATDVDVLDSYRSGDATNAAKGWTVTIRTDATVADPTQLTVNVICITDR